MAVYQETTTVSATRPLLRAAPDSRDVSYPSSHLPSRLTGTIAGVLAVVVGAWEGSLPTSGRPSATRLMDPPRGLGISSTDCSLSYLVAWLWSAAYC
jgi:hypothetical protein